MKPNEPAAPSGTVGWPGHSKRDEIAIKAMVAILQAGQPIGTETLAERSYQIADMMIKQSNK
jgi:hypothetical protein